MAKKAKVTRQGDWGSTNPADRQFDMGGRAPAKPPRGKRDISDMETGRVPRATNMSNFRQVASEYLPRSGLERAPRPDLRQNISQQAGSNHQDDVRGSGY